jgi:thymidylate kinase
MADLRLERNLHLDEKFRTIYEEPNAAKYAGSIPMIGILGTDKAGKGTTFRQTLYALSEMGYNVLGVPFPMYNYVDGLLIEMGLSSKALSEKLPDKLKARGHDVGAWSFSNDLFLHNYPRNRLHALPTIKEHVDKGYLIVTKRSSKATHATYQAGLNDQDLQKVMGLDGFFPNPLAIALLSAESVYTKDFATKGSAVLDMNESKDQSPVARLKEAMCMDPGYVGAKYGCIIPNLEADERLDDLLAKLKVILEKEGFKPGQTRGDLKIFGLEEPPYQFREDHGIDRFLSTFDGSRFLMGEFQDHWEHYGALGQDDRYLQLFTNPLTGKQDRYPLTIKEKVDAALERHREGFGRLR